MSVPSAPQTSIAARNAFVSAVVLKTGMFLSNHKLMIFLIVAALAWGAVTVFRSAARMAGNRRDVTRTALDAAFVEDEVRQRLLHLV